MGNSAQTLILQTQVMNSTIHSMMQFSNTNIKLRLLKEHSETFLFHQLNEDASTDHAIRLGKYFNKQSAGFRLKDI